MSTLQNASHTQSIFDFLTGKVPGLSIGNTIGGTASENVVLYRGGRPSFYLNEIYIQTSQLLNINMSDVVYIKVYSPPFFGGLGDNRANGSGFASGSAIAIYTKRGGDLSEEKSKFNTSGMDFKMQAGYAPIKEFYAPSYAEKEQSIATTDIRTTLLWNPEINLDKINKKAKIRFYNNDRTHSFRIILEGMDSKGKLIHINQLIK
jgi:hypothetical protein